MSPRRKSRNDVDFDRQFRLGFKRLTQLGIEDYGLRAGYDLYFHDFSEFEEFSKSVLGRIVFTDVDARFYRKKKYRSRQTGRDIEADISIEFSIGDLKYITIVECKYQRRAIEISKIRELIQKKNEIGAHKAVLISNAGFQGGAVSLAKSAGVALLRLGVTSDKRFSIRYISCNPMGPPPYWGIIQNLSDLSIPSPEKSVFGDIFPDVSYLARALFTEAKRDKRRSSLRRVIKLRHH